MKKRPVIVSIFGLIIVGLIGVKIYQHAVESNRSQDQKTVKKSNVQKKSTKAKNRTLVVVFSRAGQNYPNVELKTGYTQQIANLISQQTGAKQYVITPVKAYPHSYQATVKRATTEQNNNARPKIKGQLPDFTKYDTIFIGYPIWDAHLPMIMHTFMEAAKLNGKTIIPFSTNAGSGWSDSREMLKNQYPQATFKQGLSIPGADVATSHDKINKWLTKLGY